MRHTCRLIHRFAALPVLALLTVAAAQAQTVAAPVTPAAPAAPATTAPAPKPEFRIHQVRPGINVLLSASGNITVWSGPDGIVLVDDGYAAQAPQLLEAVARLSRAPLRFVIDTHWHPDHTGGNEALAKAGAVVIAQVATRERLAQQQVDEEYDVKVPPAPPIALPVITFADALNLHLNGDQLTAVHISGAHSDSDVILRWQGANVVQVGDIFYNGGYPYIDTPHGGSLAGVVAALEGTLARSDAQTVVIPGHGPVAKRADLAAYRDMLVAIGRKVREDVEAGKSIDEVLATHPTADFDERYGKGGMNPERFIRLLYRDLGATSRN
jgi:glyoxylase-like metal-dependent hydrolase (beta-lactamase superfamily II)